MASRTSDTEKALNKLLESRVDHGIVKGESEKTREPLIPEWYNHTEALKQCHSPLKVQVAGNHYTKLKIQPVEYIHANGLGYIEGAIIKYISRYKNKNGKEDLLKIKHFVDLLIELEYKDKE